jgi:hypothetical protein
VLLAPLLLTIAPQSIPPDVQVLGPAKPNGQTPATMVVEPAAMLIVACDADGDGRTTRTELDDCLARSFTTMAESSGGQLGYIAYADWQKRWLGDQGALPSPFEVDRDGDNRITLVELQSQFAKLFARYDKDGDRAVTRSEALTIRASAAGGQSRRPGKRPGGERSKGERVPGGTPNGEPGEP